MKIINADCMKENIKAKYNPGFKDILGQWIDKQPTVNAISIDTIEEALEVAEEEMLDELPFEDRHKVYYMMNVLRRKLGMFNNDYKCADY